MVVAAAPASAGSLLGDYRSPTSILADAMAAGAAQQAQEARIRAEVEREAERRIQNQYCNRSMFDRSALPNFCR
jgi:hypothetical protein